MVARSAVFRVGPDLVRTLLLVRDNERSDKVRTHTSAWPPVYEGPDLVRTLLPASAPKSVRTRSEPTKVRTHDSKTS